LSVIFVLIAVSMVVAGGFLIGFLWAVKKGQYEDTYSPSVRILFDDEELLDQEKSKTKDIKEDESKSSEEK
jgi:cbb3-type cytochrome oxidase maturation protein